MTDTHANLRPFSESINQTANRQLLEVFVAHAIAASPWIKDLAGHLDIIRTEAIDGMRVVDAFAASCFNKDSGIGMTALVWGPQHFKAFLEIVGGPNDGLYPGVGFSFRVGLAGATLGKAMQGEWDDAKLARRDDGGG